MGSLKDSSVAGSSHFRWNDASNPLRIRCFIQTGLIRCYKETHETKRVCVAATAASSTDATASTNLAVEVTCEDNTHDCPALNDERTTKADAITPSSRVVIESIYWEDLPSGGQGHSMSDCSSESDDWGHDTHAHGVGDELDPISARPQKISPKELNRAIRGFKDREKETGVPFAIPVRDDAKIAFS